MKYDYGDPARGLSFEHYNFYETLRHMGHDLVYFDFMTLLGKLGRDEMNKRLVDVARAEKPDLMFTFLFTDEFKSDVVRLISMTDTTTLNWFADDHWRFEIYSRQWAPNFNWVVTTAADAIPKYLAAGYPNAIKSQWACNHFVYRKLDVPLRYDVTFVGQLYGERPEVIRQLRHAGVDVRVWGHRWETGRLSQDEMIRVFNESRINLNLAAAYRPPGRPPTTAERLAGSLHRHGIGRLAERPLRPLVRAGRRVLQGGRAGETAPARAPAVPDQIKGRNFEVPGCGGFLLTGYADDLERYYTPGEDVACFASADELIQQAVYYLEHDEERTRIAASGYQRTLREHTYIDRFAEIFRRIGLSEAPRTDSCGDVLEIA